MYGSVQRENALAQMFKKVMAEHCTNTGLRVAVQTPAQEAIMSTGMRRTVTLSYYSTSLRGCQCSMWCSPGTPGGPDFSVRKSKLWEAGLEPPAAKWQTQDSNPASSLQLPVSLPVASLQSLIFSTLKPTTLNSTALNPARRKTGNDPLQVIHRTIHTSEKFAF